MAELEAINPLSYITDWTPIPATAANASGWFQTEYARVDVDEDEKPGNLPWFLAQGWIVYAVASTIRIGGKNPGVVRRSYSLSRKKLQSDRVLQTMINEFTSAYNEGRLLNDRRYDEIVQLYDVMLSRSTAEANAVTDFVGTYESLLSDIALNQLPDSSSEIEAVAQGLISDYGTTERARASLYAGDLALLATDYGTVLRQLATTQETAALGRMTDYEARFRPALESHDSDTKRISQAFEAAQNARLAAYRAKAESALDTFDANQITRISEYQSNVDSKLDTFLSSNLPRVIGHGGNITTAVQAFYTTHGGRIEDFETTITGLLDDFGEGERARIEDQFDNELANARQSLTSRGLYNTTVWEGVSMGIERLRSRMLLELADRLAERSVGILTTVQNIRNAFEEGAVARDLEWTERTHQDRTRMEEGILDRRIVADDRKAQFESELRVQSVNRQINLIQALDGNEAAQKGQQTDRELRRRDSIHSAKQSLESRQADRYQAIVSQVYGIRAAFEDKILSILLSSKGQAHQVQREVEAAILDKSLVSENRLHEIRQDARARIESACVRLMEMKKNRQFSSSELRNAVLTAMLSFMERRTDEYPGVGELANIAAGLGYGEGSSVPGVTY